MARSPIQLTSFKSGEIGDVLTSQVDTMHYKTGVKLAENCFVTHYGTIRKRPGSEFIYNVPTNVGFTYLNAQSVGDRTSLITVTDNVTLLQSTTPAMMVDGTIADSASYSVVLPKIVDTGDYFKFDFGANVRIDEMKFYFPTQPTSGYSYSHSLGSGDRTSTIVITSNIVPGSTSTWNNAVDGSTGYTAANAVFLPSEINTNDYFKFDFGKNVAIEEIKFKMPAVTSAGLSYSNTGGTGDRTSLITTTQTGFTQHIGNVNTPAVLVNGVNSGSDFSVRYGVTSPIDIGDEFRFQFQGKVAISEVKIYVGFIQGTTTGLNTNWDLESSNDGSSWTTQYSGSVDIVTASGGTPVTISASDSTNGYIYWRFKKTTNNVNSMTIVSFVEFEFKISNDLSLEEENPADDQWIIESSIDDATWVTQYEGDIDFTSTEDLITTLDSTNDYRYWRVKKINGYLNTLVGSTGFEEVEFKIADALVLEEENPADDQWIIESSPDDAAWTTQYEGDIDFASTSDTITMGDNTQNARYWRVTKQNGTLEALVGYMKILEAEFKIYTNTNGEVKLAPYSYSAGTTYTLLLGDVYGYILSGKDFIGSSSALVIQPNITDPFIYYQNGKDFYYLYDSGSAFEAFYRYVYADTATTFASGTLSPAANANYLGPTQTKYFSSSGYAITSMTAVYREGQTSINISGANPGPFTGGNGFSAGANKVIHALDGVFEITGVTNDYTLVATCRRGNVTTSTSNLNWSLEYSFNEYGRVGTFHNNRMIAGVTYEDEVGTATTKQGKILMSAVNSYTDFYPGPNADDAIHVTINKVGAGGITWMCSDIDLLVGTDKGVVSIKGNTAETIEIVNRNGPGGIKQLPAQGHGGVYYISSTQTQVRYLKYDDRLQGYTNEEITLTIPHRFEDMVITQLAVMDEPYPIVFASTDTGKILAGTVIKNPLINSPLVAWTVFADNDDTEWSDPIVVKNNYRDELWCIATRGSVKTVERFTFTTGDEQLDIFTDGTVTYNSVATSTITGLTHLNGLACQVKATGVLRANTTPSAGSATLDGSYSVVTVGLPFEMRLDIQQPYIPVGLGSMEGQKFRWVEPIIALYRSKVPEVDGNEPSKIKGTATINGIELVTGKAYYGTVDDEVMQIRDDTPFPIHITGIFGQIEYGS